MAALAIAILVVAGMCLAAWHDTMADPVVRRTTVALPGMPAGSAPVTIALLADFHPAEPDMPPARLARIVGQVNALKPDVIVLAGDFISDPGFGLRPYPIAASIAPLGKLRARLGIYAVMGNHDSSRDLRQIRLELARQGITVLGWNARAVGPLVIGGINHPYIGRRRLVATLATMHRLDGGPVLVSHYPDPFAHLPANTGLMLAGHTHCGQISLFGWAPITGSSYGQRYACGVVRERGNTLVVTAGLGTSIIPVRFGARPDIWLVEVRPR
ncbi:MAG: metallophosphoesterase family protein [Porphyrobacter sp.]|nr:metallophosphoesterase family protein [Porphyrobacter sp.]